MGYSKVVAITERKVKFVHQLDSDGTAYAEDITIEIDETVDPSRLKYLVDQDGKIGYASVSFSAATESEQNSTVRFPEE